MEDTISSKEFWECKSCNINSKTKDRMIPCPRGGCDAEIIGHLIKKTHFEPLVKVLDNHSHVLVDFENPSISIEETASDYYLGREDYIDVEKAFIEGAKSEAAKQYWFKIFKQENK